MTNSKKAFVLVSSCKRKIMGVIIGEETFADIELLDYDRLHLGLNDVDAIDSTAYLQLVKNDS